MTTLKDILALLAILACYGIAGRLDYDDAVRHEAYMHSRGLERPVCAHDSSSTSAEVTPATLDDPDDGPADRDCKPPSL